MLDLKTIKMLKKHTAIYCIDLKRSDLLFEENSLFQKVNEWFY